MSLINLHNHSTYSDGTLAPKALALEAARAGIKYFSLTDHDTIDGWPEMGLALETAGIKYCSGVEISTRENGNLHILGYGMNPTDPGFVASLEEFRERRAARIKKMLEKLNCLGIEIKFEDLKPRGGVSPGRGQVADLMVQRKIVSDIKEAFKLFLSPGAAAYEPSAGPTVEEAIRVIKGADGKAVLAHPIKAGTTPDLAAMKDAGLDGLEAFYPSHSPGETKNLIALAERHELFVTAGCDFHGPPFDRCVMSGFEYPDEYFVEIKDLFL